MFPANRPAQTTVPAQKSAEQIGANQMPALLNYSELVELSIADKLRPELIEKLTQLSHTPFINNDAYHRGAKPVRPVIDGLGPALRVVMWNIGRGEQIDDLLKLISDKQAYLDSIDPDRLKKLRTDLDELATQIDLFNQADVLVLQELDWGIKRTGYRELIRELGEKLNMNWAYGVEFIEVDPVQLGLERAVIDPELYRGLHGTAILSRYPIESAKLQPLKVQGYDWYQKEKLRPTLLEQSKRVTSNLIFQEKIGREIRRGGRTMLSVTLLVPDLPEQRLMIAAPHLENRCKPKVRSEQFKEVLSYIHAVDYPVVLAGDLNTSTRDESPISLKEMFLSRVKNKAFWLQNGIKHALGIGIIFDMLQNSINFSKNLCDPTKKHIPIIAPNPERGLFAKLEKFRFKDGYVFDLRGDSIRTSNELAGTLANSNERASKGFAATFEVARAIGPVGKFKLDWIFVKSYLTDPNNNKAGYNFSPQFPRTLRILNYSSQQRISDHSPISVDLPFLEAKKY